jgi:hypothetical protein
MKLKNIITYFIGTLCISCFCNAVTYAITCYDDTNDMYSEIKIVKHLRTADGKQLFNIVEPPFELENTCFARLFLDRGGRRDPKYICHAKWIKGNWRDTINCK